MILTECLSRSFWLPPSHCSLWTFFPIHRNGTSQSREAGGLVKVLCSITALFTKPPAELFLAFPGTIPVEQKKIP